MQQHFFHIHHLSKIKYKKMAYST